MDRERSLPIILQPLPEITIQTLEGNMICNIGDWVIRGTEGEFYPCKDSVFQRKYRRYLPVSKERFDAIIGPSIGEQLRNLADDIEES